MSVQVGKTIMAVTPRRGPGVEHPAVGLLPARSELFILAEDGEWRLIRSATAGGIEGFVLRDYLVTPEQEVRDGFFGPGWAPALPGGPKGPGDPASSLPLEPPDFMRLTLARATNENRRLAADTWNRAGGLLAALAEELKITPGVAVAVLAIESRGKGFAPDGRMIIRFENHIFDKFWGVNNRERFNAHFRYHPDERWKEHRWRPSTDQPFRDLHTREAGQAAEWEVFEFARALDDRAAKFSISMGGPQIMGFNHTRIGYDSVHQMFEAFAAGESRQVVGFFDFVKGSGPHDPKVIALQQRDFETFATLYNGKGKESLKYADKMRGAFEAFQELWFTLRIRRVKADTLNLRKSPEVLPDNILRPDMPVGTHVEILDFKPVAGSGAFWVNVRVEQDAGWVNRSFLDPMVG